MQSQKQDYSWGDIVLFALGSLAGAIAGLWAVSRLLSAMAAQAPGFWFVSRASAVVGFLLLWLSTAWGVSLSSKGMAGVISAPLAFALHNITSWLALGFGAVHAVSLLGDQVVPFTIAGVLVPFASGYQPFLTGLGTLSLWVGLLVSATFYWRKQIGYRAWRVIHMLSYLMFVAVVVHSVLLGTDSSSPVMQGVYIVAGSSVLFLTLFRILTAGSNRRAASPSAAH